MYDSLLYPGTIRTLSCSVETCARRLKKHLFVSCYERIWKFSILRYTNALAIIIIIITWLGAIRVARAVDPRRQWGIDAECFPTAPQPRCRVTRCRCRRGCCSSWWSWLPGVRRRRWRQTRTLIRVSLMPHAEVWPQNVVDHKTRGTATSCLHLSPWKLDDLWWWCCTVSRFARLKHRVVYGVCSERNTRGDSDVILSPTVAAAMLEVYCVAAV